MDTIRNQIHLLSRWMIKSPNGAFAFALLGIVALLVWNLPLLLALGIALGASVLVYRGAQVSIWEAGQEWLRSHLTSPLPLALLIGLLSLIISYSTLLIWQDTGRFGIALAALLQGGCTLLAVGLLVRQLLQPVADAYEQWVMQLAAPEPLQRMMAVRRLSQIADLSAERQHELSEYFQLLLVQERQPQIRKAVLQMLEQLDPPAAEAIRLKRRSQHRIKIRRERVYAELEAQPEEILVQ